MSRSLPGDTSGATGTWALFWAALFLLAVSDVTNATSSSSIFGLQGFGKPVGFTHRRQYRQFSTTDETLALAKTLQLYRGGASLAAIKDEDEDDEDDEEDDEDEQITESLISELEEVQAYEDDEEAVRLEKPAEEMPEFDPKLSLGTTKSSLKIKIREKAARTSAIKEAVKVKLAKTAVPAIAPARMKSMFRLPYIVRAILNPVTAFAMIKAFWVSLFSLDYPPKDSSQDLRSALEEKNKKSGSLGGKPKKKMKRGQAKTLSDLPQLST